MLNRLTLSCIRIYDVTEYFFRCYILHFEIPEYHQAMESRPGYTADASPYKERLVVNGRHPHLRFLFLLHYVVDNNCQTIVNPHECDRSSRNCTAVSAAHS